MKKKKAVENGGGAFPFCMWLGDHHAGHNLGITVRDYFAAKAMAALIVAPGRVGDECRVNDERLACWAYQVADSMLTAKSRQPGAEK